MFVYSAGGREAAAGCGGGRARGAICLVSPTLGRGAVAPLSHLATGAAYQRSQPGRDQGRHPPGRCRLRCPSGRQREPHCPRPSSETSTLAGHLPGRLGEEGRQRLGAAAPAQRALLRGLAGLWSPEHSAHTAVPRDEAAAPCAGSRPRPRQCPGRPASWPAASAPVPRLCQFFLRAGPGGCACCEMSGFGAALRPGAGRRRLSSLGRLRIQCVAPAA